MPAPSDRIPVKDIRSSALLDCLLGRGTKPRFALNSTVRDGRKVAIEQKVVIERPFCALRSFRGKAGETRPNVLLVAPLAGQYATLLRDTVAGLLPHSAVYLTDWIDARMVPVGEGDFDLDRNIDYVMDFVRALGPDVHVLAVCQSVVPTLAAIALLAAGGERAQPRSMVLMGGLVDTRISPTRVDRLARRLALSWLDSAVIGRVPAGFPGRGRRVYPAAAQRAGLLAYLARHLEYLGGVPSRVRVRGDEALADPQFLERLLTLMDLPAELFLQNIKTVFQDHALPRHSMTWRGRRVEPEAIGKTALLTVEGEFDDISGKGQTRAAHDLCAGIPRDMRRHHEQAGVGHFGMYVGRYWLREVAPLLGDFIRAHN